MPYRFALLAATALVAVSTLAQAQNTPPTSSQSTSTTIVYDNNPNWGLSSAGLTPGPYLKGTLGGSFADSSRFGNSMVYGAGIGYRFSPWFRTDLTVDFRPDFKDSNSGGASFRNWATMLNGYIDFNVPPMRPSIPYIGMGVGMAQNKVNGSVVNVGGTSTANLTGSSKNQFAWQAMAGASYYFTPTTALDVGYRYFYGGSAESGSGSGFPTRSGDFDSHEILASVRWGF